MPSMTYGKMPQRQAFSDAWDAANLRNNRYHIQLGSSDSRAVDKFRLGDGDWTENGLWDALEEIVNAPDSDGREYALDLVSSILDTLGFEWV